VGITTKDYTAKLDKLATNAAASLPLKEPERQLKLCFEGDCSLLMGDEFTLM